MFAFPSLSRRSAPGRRTGLLFVGLLLAVALLSQFIRPFPVAADDSITNDNAGAVTPAAVTVVGQIIVDTNTLSPTTAGNPNDGKCDLREALQAASRRLRRA